MDNYYDGDHFLDILPEIRKEIAAAYARELGYIFDASRLFGTSPIEEAYPKEEEVDW